MNDKWFFIQIKPPINVLIVNNQLTKSKRFTSVKGSTSQIIFNFHN